MGGYREGSGRSKHGYYKGIYCGSTYELCWGIYNLDKGIKFIRFPGCIESDGIKYYPDFLLEGGKTIVETKGYEPTEKVNKKCEVARKHGYNVIVLREKDLHHVFEYVKQTYNTSKYYTLYDNYKPVFNYRCHECGHEFKRDFKLKTANVFCSRKCSGKFRKKENTFKSKKRSLPGKYIRELSKKQALEIFNNKSSPLSVLAKKYKITVGSVSFIKTKKTYKWIHN
jgi:hypothetical protein